MNFGVALSRVNPAYFVDVAVEADRLGFESVWLAEHLVFPVEMTGQLVPGEDHPPVPPSTPVFDAAAYLSFLAARTEQIRLGTYVYLLGLRHPFVSARAFATLDVVSGGRAEVGVGAGWLLDEWVAAGLDPGERGRRLDEAIDVCRLLWADEVIDFHGEFFDFEPVMFEPKPVQQPLPVLVGGESARALRRAAEKAEGWIGMAHTPESLAARVGELRAAEAGAGRVDRPLQVSCAGRVDSTSDVERFAAAGCDRLIVSPWSRSSDAVAGLREFAERFLA
ncbi:MAG: hypothetical protein JJLCMIEE_03539 [Acidimicrobiales bacterium]|nr:hypothetical protein [Acidimicrobiales bacterium]